MVKTERLELVIEILTSQMNHWVFFPLVMTALGLFMQISGNQMEDGPGLLQWAFYGLIPVACFWIRNYVNRFWLFVICHVAAIAAALSVARFLLHGNMVLGGICAAAYVVYSFTLRIKEEPDIYSGVIHPVTALVVSAVANFMFHRQEVPDWDKYYVFILIGVLAGYLIIYYLRHYLSFLRVNKSSTGYLPARDILQSGIGFVLPYTLVGVLILLLSLNVQWLEHVLRFLKEVLKIVLTLILRLLPGGGSKEELLPPENTGSASNGGMLPLPKSETFWLWEVLEYVAIIAFAIWGIYLFVKAFRWFIQYLKVQFGRQMGSKQIVTGLDDVFDVREKCKIDKQKNESGGAGLFQRFTPVERVRRLYKKSVLSGTVGAEDRESLKYMTAKECGKKLSLPDMAEIYGQARYSGKEIVPEDVKRMKLACSKKYAPQDYGS